MEIGDVMMTRDGRAEVVAIDGRAVTLRLPDGNQMEIRPPAPAKPSGTRSRRVPKAHFDGFSQEDFKDNVTGTTWRSRAKLGGEVTARLGGAGFNSYVVYRVPECHWARESHWEKGRETHHCKLFTQLSSDAMRCGFHIERQSSDYALSEDWGRFARWIGTEGAQALIRELTTVKGFSLRGWVGELGIRFEVTTEGWNAVMGEATVAVAPEKLGLFLTEEMPSNWLGFYIEKVLPPGEAIGMGSSVAAVISDALNELLPVYDAVADG
jgi:hypothetical protein